MSYKEKIKKAQEIKGNAAGWFRERRDKINAELNKVKTDPHLTVEGRLAKSIELKNKFGNELLKEAHQLRNEYIKLLNDAKADAEKTLKTAIKKPNDDVVSEFQRDLKRFKTELMLANSFGVIEKKLDDFIKAKVNDAYLAQMVADEFPEIIGQALSVTSNVGFARKKLSDVYERLNNDFLPDEAKEARAALDHVNAAVNSKLFPSIVEQAAQEIVGKEFAQYLNDTDSYVEQIES